MVKPRSLSACPEGIRAAEQALIDKGWSQEDLARKVVLEGKQQTTGIDEQTVYKFFSGGKNDRKFFSGICKALELDWKVISGLTQSAESVPKQPQEDYSTALVQTVRSQIRPLIQERYGKMRVLEVGWVPVDEIYVSLKVLKPVDHNHLFTEQRDQLQVERSDDDYQNQIKRFHRIGLSQNSRQAEAALKVLRDYKKAIILGTPGAGKTTLLRSLAIECIKEQPALEELKHYVPVFLVLKDVVKDFAKELDGKERLVLVKAIQWEMQSWAIEPEVIETLLNSGKLFLLLDGLDEVSEHYGEAIVDQIRQLCQRQQYGINRILVTCRTQQQQYRFDSSIVDLELDDFSPDQVKQFIKRWFALVSRKDGAVLANQLIHQLEAEENKPVAELAVTPILLNLVCVVALRHQGTLPKRRSDLYTDGIRALLTEWDKFEGKQQRQRRSTLSVDEKEDLLSYIALALFEQNDYIPERKTLECLIRSRLNIPRSQAETLLKSFETEHGLLVERDRNYWSFSHLTFHEYFAAREIVESPDPEILQRFAKNIVEKRWREVFLLAVEMLPEEKADELVGLMKREIDELLEADEKSQELLGWIQEKSASVDACYKPMAVRAFYFALGLRLAFTPFIALYLACSLDPALALDLGSPSALDPALALDYDITCSPINLAFDLTSALNFAHTQDPELQCKLQELKKQLPEMPYENQDIFFELWEKDNGENWSKHLQELIIKDRKIIHDWQFSESQKKQVWQYYNANKLLIDCLNSGYVSRDVREEIEETLLLPMSEIKKRRK